MNELPRRTPGEDYVIRYQFPKDLPIFWGPNQRILEDKKYIEPSGWHDEECLVVPYIVRFIHDSGSIDSDLADGVIDDPGGGGPGDGAWELYLTQQSVCIVLGTEGLNGGFVPSNLCPDLYSASQFGEIGGIPNTVAYPTGLSKILVWGPNTDACNPTRLITATIGEFVGMNYLKMNGYYVHWYWRKLLGNNQYDYYTTSGCSDDSPERCRFSMESPRSTPQYFQEFPWTPDQNAPPCPGTII